MIFWGVPECKSDSVIWFFKQNDPFIATRVLAAFGRWTPVHVKKFFFNLVTDKQPKTFLLEDGA